MELLCGLASSYVHNMVNESVFIPAQHLSPLHAPLSVKKLFKRQAPLLAHRVLHTLTAEVMSFLTYTNPHSWTFMLRGNGWSSFPDLDKTQKLQGQGKVCVSISVQWLEIQKIKTGRFRT